MSPPGGRDSAPPSSPTLNRVRLNDIERDVSREFLIQIVGLFVSDVAERLERLSDAVKARETQRTTSLAHQLQGSAASLGVLRLRSVARRLEELAEKHDWGASDATLARLIKEFQHVRQVLATIRSEPPTSE
jgi:HPt (histidine-containing phosphotransfer) domain-containing protein